MSLFGLLFPGESAQLKLNARRINQLLSAAGIDDAEDPAFANVVAELRAGRDIKAAQLYCQTTGAGVGEARIAVSEIKARLAR